jgi:basic membrane protein A
VYAHAQSIAHRDIKPDNVMVLEGDRVKVTDFGIARILQRDTSLQTFATTGMRMGTPLYMAPEQVEGKKIDGRTDIYALGAVMYHMVTGRPPFEGDDPLAVALKHVQEEPASPSSIDPTIPEDWNAVILKALAKDPAERFQSAKEMEGAVAVLSDQAATTSPEPAVNRKPATTRRMRVGWFGAAAGLAALLLAGGIYLEQFSVLFPGRSSGVVASHARSACIPAYVDYYGNFTGSPPYRGFERAVSGLRAAKPLVYDGSKVADIYTELSLIAQRHPCITVLMGLTDAGVLTSLSARYPGVNFALIDNTTYNTRGPVTLRNVEEWTIPSQQAGYLVGYLAGLMERQRVGKAVHGVIGVMGGVSVPPVDYFIDGYRQGARAAYPGIKILADYANSFTDQHRALAIGLKQISHGADILFGVAGDASLGYWKAAKERGMYAIGVDVDRSYLGPYVLTSALKNYDTVVYDAVMQAAQNHFKGGEHSIGLADGGVGIGRLSRIVPASIAAAVQAQERKIIHGEITVQP